MAQTSFGDIFRVKTPFVFTIFGASGDLAKLKIFPALFALAEQNRLPKKYFFIGYARTEKSQEEFQQEVEISIRSAHQEGLTKYQEEVLKNFMAQVSYFSGQYDGFADFEKYKLFRDDLTKEKITEISYFSVPPQVFAPIVENLSEIRETREDDVRLIIEKPFGEDEKTARELFHFIARFFEEKNIYLLDHYLGKKAVRSILPLRHVNRILNLMLKGREIANIQISAFEDFGVENRLGYFEHSGIVKDMIQSHLLQILAFVTMSIPIETTAENIQKEKAAILSTLRFYPEQKNISLGQYAGYPVEGSMVPTFAAVKFFINRETWYDVPIFLRTGKNLHEKHTFLVIELKKFRFQDPDNQPNRVIIELFPDEKIHLKLLDEDGVTSRMEEISTSESIACTGDYCLPAHSLLFLDVLQGDKKYFLSFEEILASWKFTDHILNFVASEGGMPDKYDVGSEGPESYKALTDADGFTWYDLHGKS